MSVIHFGDKNGRYSFGSLGSWNCFRPFGYDLGPFDVMRFGLLDDVRSSVEPSCNPVDLCAIQLSSSVKRKQT